MQVIAVFCLKLKKLYYQFIWWDNSLLIIFLKIIFKQHRTLTYSCKTSNNPTHFSNYIYFLSHSSLWLLQTIIFVRESDLIDQRRILSIIHAHCFKLSKNVPFQNMVENPSNALIHSLCNF